MYSIPHLRIDENPGSGDRGQLFRARRSIVRYYPDDADGRTVVQPGQPQSGQPQPGQQSAALNADVVDGVALTIAGRNI